MANSRTTQIILSSLSVSPMDIIQDNKSDNLFLVYRQQGVLKGVLKNHEFCIAQEMKRIQSVKNGLKDCFFLPKEKSPAEKKHDEFYVIQEIIYQRLKSLKTFVNDEKDVLRLNQLTASLVSNDIIDSDPSLTAAIKTMSEKYRVLTEVYKKFEVVLNNIEMLNKIVNQLSLNKINQEGSVTVVNQIYNDSM